ncbi:HD domain-containing phosphohydrolase [Roseibium aggregatum]|uniref:Response regulator n=1 Tax=Roseibium aggregatum TaxID=187304 RepID=A0A939EH30_9HYPH|nr:HD domain-containing phosphohydrolase [Roseibium aggregatum]MBN9672098.1 response regulator [Roseibium aggregatum]
MSGNRTVLLVDDDTNVLNAAARVLRKVVDVATVNSPQLALEKIKTSGPFAVVVSDQNMPGMDGIKLLGLISKKAPSTTRIMLTGDNDQKTAVKAVNDGRIFRFIGKPCDSESLQKVIEEGIAHHQTLVAERELLEHTLSGSVKMLVDIIALSRPHAHVRASVIQRWARKISRALGTKPSLEQGVSAMLCTLGYLTLPDRLAERYFVGDALSPEEMRQVNEAASQARDLVLNIPRMEGIAEAIYYCRKGFDGSGFPNDEIEGESLPEASRVLCALIDLAEIATGDQPNFEACITELEQNAPRYDPRILGAMRQVLGGDQVFAGTVDVERKKVPAARLLSGDTLATDVRDGEGRLLLAAGSHLSPITIKRLRAVSVMNSPDVHFDVWRQSVPASASAAADEPVS